jgi:hypothetical protein
VRHSNEGFLKVNADGDRNFAGIAGELAPTVDLRLMVTRKGW